MNSSRYRLLSHPIWQYLNQTIFDPRNPAILNPRQFWGLYRIQYLERCLARDFRFEERHRNQG